MNKSSLFVPGLVTQKTLDHKRFKEVLSKDHNEMLNGYQISTEIDRKLVLGYFEQQDDSSDHQAAVNGENYS